MSLMLEVKKGALKNGLLKFQPKVDWVEREGRVCRRGTGSTQGPCGGREQPVSVRGLGSQFRDMCLMLHCKGNPLEGLGKRVTVIKLQFRLKKNKQNDQTPMTAVGK